MSRPLRLATVLVIFAAALVIAPERARACSCEMPDPYRQLERTDAAFVGELVSRPEDAIGENGDYIFSVEQVVKGDLPGTVTVRSPLDGAACGIEAAVGQRIGLFLRRDGSHWEGGLCDQVDPDALLMASKPLPPPKSGVIVALAAMTTPEGRAIALDAEGKILAHGAGEGEIVAFALCPEARTVVEHALVRAESGAPLASILGVRDLMGFHIVWETSGPQVPVSIADMACAHPAGDEILVLSAGRLSRATNDSVVEIAALEEQAGCPDVGRFNADASTVYFIGSAGCRGLYRHDIATGSTTEIARIPDDAGIDALVAISLSPDGRYLAMEAHPGPEPLTFRLLMFDLAAEPVDYAEASFGDPFELHTLLWTQPDRLLLTGTTDSLDEAFILDPRFETTGKIIGISGGSGGVHADTIYVLEPYGDLVTAPLEGGYARQAQTFSDLGISVFMTLPESEHYDPIAAQPDNLTTINTRDFVAPSAIAETPVTESEGIEATGAGRLLAAGIVFLLAGTAGFLILRSRRERRSAEA